MNRVTGPSGSEYEVIHECEVDFWNSASSRYLEQFKFENISDLQDLDRVLVGEVLCYRWGTWLTAEADYDGRSIEELSDKLKKQKIEQEKETRILKEKMGLNRAHRQDSDQQNMADYLSTLLRRAKEFGVHRDHQVAKSVDLLHEIFVQVGLYQRCDEEERAHLRVNPEDIIGWIWDVARSEYEAIDAAFRANQRLWIKDIA